MDSHTSNEVTRLLSRLIAAGATLRVRGDWLGYSGPAGLLSDEDEAFIRAHRPDVLGALREWERSLDGLDWPLVRESDYTMDGNSCGCVN